jgi:hypothetical protein
MNITDMTNPDANPIPEEAQALVAALLEGRVKSLAVVAEIEDADGQASWINEYWIDLDEHSSDRRGFIGTMHMLVHDMTDGINFEEQELIEVDLSDFLDGDDDDDLDD